MDNPNTRVRDGWIITIHENSEGYYTDCVSPDGITTISTDVYSKKNDASHQASNIVDREVREEESRAYNAIVAPLTLALIYISKHPYKGYDFDIFKLLTSQGLLEEPSSYRVKSVTLTQEGIKQAIDILNNLNLAGIKDYLEKHLKQD